MNKKIVQYIKYARGMLALTVLCGVLLTLATIAQMTALSRIVNQVFLAHRGLEQVWQLLLVLAGTILLRAAFTGVREIVAQQSAIRVKTELRTRLFAHVLQLGPAFSKGERTGELVASATEGIERLDGYISRYLPQTVLSVLVPLLIVLAILPADGTSALLLLITGPIIPLLMVLVGSYAEKHTQQQWVALSRLSAHFLDAIQGLTTLKLFGRSQAEQKRIARSSDLFREKTLKVLRIAFLSGGVLEFMTALAIGLIAVTLGVRLLDHGIAFESAFLVLLLTPEFYRPLRDLGTQRHIGMEGKAAAERIVEILETPLPVRDGSHATDLSQAEMAITLQDVTYHYAESEVSALDSITLTLPARTCTALVGHSGAGKSTLANLLLRFMDAESGTIRANGLEITDLPVEAWRASIALVPQRPYLFYGSVRENIRMARPTASDAEIIEATRQAGALPFIEQLSQGFETAVGEQGMRLSAGEIQRIAIARAFLKDAPFLILDEPTSSLDPESELLIRHAVERLMQDRTVLVIAHRYNTIANAGQVAVLDHGRLVEVGQPTVLLAQGGAFARLMGQEREKQVS